MHGPGGALLQAVAQALARGDCLPEKRGLTGEIAARFALGYAPDGWTPLQQAFDDYLDDNLVECGLVLRHDDGRRYDRFRHRIMFPIRSSRGDIIGFGGRVLDRASQNT